MNRSPMTVRELREALDDVPADRCVTLSTDAAGNYTKYVFDVDTEAPFVPTSPLMGDGLHPDDVEEFLEENPGVEVNKVVTLWPNA